MTFFFPVDPQPKGRPRFARRGRLIVTRTPGPTRAYEREIATLARNQMGSQPLMTDPLIVQLLFFLKKPPSAKRSYPTTKPDLDNLIKAVLDAMNGIIWKDDTQVVDLHVHKRYSLNGNPHFVMKVDPQYREVLKSYV